MIANLVWGYHQPLMILAECNNIKLLWLLGHKRTEGNETADQIAINSNVQKTPVWGCLSPIRARPQVADRGMLSRYVG
jgi:hypothetical protein